MTGDVPIRVLVVDDSALMRKMIADMLRSAPGLEVVGSARDGTEAIDLAGRLKPDVITLDVEMPGMSGIDALPAILDAHDASVLMVSALTQQGADATLAALELGAVDFLPKPGGPRGIAELKDCRDQLVEKVRAVARGRRRQRPRANSARPGTTRPRGDRAAIVNGGPSTASCVAIGISTGGPQALGLTFPTLRPPIPPVIVVQHMPAQFTGPFAARLARHCSVPLKEAEDGDPVLPDRILIAPGGRHLFVVGRPPLARVTSADGPPVSGHRPSIDILFQSVARVFGPSAVGILMTGMGRDGVEGCKQILDAGGWTLGQDEATSVVYGMNRAAFREGAIKQEFPLEDLPALIARFADRTRPSGD